MVTNRKQSLIFQYRRRDDSELVGNSREHNAGNFSHWLWENLDRRVSRFDWEYVRLVRI